METRTCTICGSLFKYVAGEEVCINCKESDEAIFQVVREFLRENPGAKLPTVCEKTGATIGQINKFLKQGRVQTVKGNIS